MILQSLVDYYVELIKQEKIASWGWSDVNVSFALVIDDYGNIENVVSLKTQSDAKMIPQKLKVPAQVKRSSGIVANFLCDNSKFILGFDDNGRNEEEKEKSRKRAKQCFDKAKELHNKLLSDASGRESKAVLSFFNNWNPDKTYDNSMFSVYKEELLKGGNIVFFYNGHYVHEFDEIKKIWNEWQCENAGDEKITCSITGKQDHLAKLHPAIKGIRGAQPSGASIVSFNAPAFCSYGKEQGMNAQTGEYAAMAYGAALNYLIEHITYKQYIGDTAVLCYAINGAEVYQSAFDIFFMDKETSYTEKELKKILESLCEGKTIEFEEQKLDPNMGFNILGIAPNAARLSVRFFYRNSFGQFINNLRKHQLRLEIESGKQDPVPIYSLWRLLKETSRDENIPSELAGEMIRSIILDSEYPATLINAIDMRIRADHKLNETRAALIKAFYLKNKSKYVPKEVLTVSLNKETENKAYNLGRLFAVLENIQKNVNPNINATIRDKFFGSASATPSAIFPHLIELSQKHLRKMETGKRIYNEKQIGEIMEKISDTGFPRTLNMQERGVFQLGYYHQVQNFFK
ncbi:MAG: type I-C CRISPR-associated protein Cas8c/Csd1 [Lachnospiraceae bacterium]|nr:type I-C CRISPR-associated protein Cas8c/Csd1 [Lachnospiraceae bacterium]